MLRLKTFDAIYKGEPMLDMRFKNGRGICLLSQLSRLMCRLPIYRDSLYKQSLNDYTRFQIIRSTFWAKVGS